MKIFKVAIYRHLIEVILTFIIDHFTVVYSVTQPMNGSEAAGDLSLIQTSLFYHVNRVVMLTSLYLHKKSKESLYQNKLRSPAASQPAKR